MTKRAQKGKYPNQHAQSQHERTPIDNPAKIIEIYPMCQLIYKTLNGKPSDYKSHNGKPPEKVARP